MPNHYAVVCFCSADWDLLEQKGIEDVDFEPLKEVDLCRAVLPMPSVFENIVSANVPCRYRHKQTGEIHQGCNGPTKDHEQWEKVNLEQEEIDALKAEHGAATWYEWCPKYWGTKWGTYDLDVRQVGGDGIPVVIEFQCAWSPPFPNVLALIEQYLSENYCLGNFNWLGHDPANDTIKSLNHSVLI